MVSRWRHVSRTDWARRYAKPPLSYKKRCFYQVKPIDEILWRQCVFPADLDDIYDPVTDQGRDSFRLLVN